MISSLVLLILSAFGFSQTSPRKDFPNIKIKNFGQMDERFFRGARPGPGQGQFEALKALGVQTIIDLSDEPRAYEKVEAESAGLRYVHLPIVDKQPPTEEVIREFAKLIDEPGTGAFFVHCGGGKHRTGNIGAWYRFTKYGWGLEQVYKEMKNYDFYSSWGHGKQKDWVLEYAVRVEKERAAAAATAAAGNGAPQQH